MSATQARVVIKKGAELYVRGKRYKVLETNTFGGKYRYIVQDMSSGRVTLMDRDVAVEAKEAQRIRVEQGMSPLPARRKRRSSAKSSDAPSMRLIEGPRNAEVAQA